ncbi:MAG: hypothetical protein HY781_05575, partial [Chloroflexi bacterium]|nr:hypothetical protein [Chloroflexota bacterium]
VPMPQPAATQPAPTVPAGQPAAQVSITGVSFNPTTTVYYGFCQAGETTQVNIQAAVSPTNQVASVTLYYWFADQFGNYYNNDTWMAPTGGNNYSAVVDVDTEGPLTLMGDSGWLYFYAGVVDKNGAVINSNIYNVAVWYCPDQVAQPPVVPPDPVIYVEPTINYFIGPSQPVSPGDEVTIEWEVFDAPCGVYLDTNPVNTIGYYRYTVPLSGAPSTIPHQLIAYGEPCNSPSIVTRSISVTVQSAQIPNPPSNLTLETPDVHTYQFTWDDNSTNETGFKIYSTYSNSQTTANVHTYTVFLQNMCGLQLTYYVTAYNNAGESAPSNSVTLEQIVLCPPETPYLQWNEFYSKWEIFYPGPWGSTFMPARIDVYKNYNFYYQTSEHYLEPPSCGTSWNAYVTIYGPGGESAHSNTVLLQGICP